MTHHEEIVTPLTTMRVHVNQDDQTVSLHIGQTELVFTERHTCSQTVVALCLAGDHLSHMSPPPPPSLKDGKQRRHINIA